MVAKRGIEGCTARVLGASLLDMLPSLRIQEGRRKSHVYHDKVVGLIQRCDKVLWFNIIVHVPSLVQPLYQVQHFYSNLHRSVDGYAELAELVEIE